MLVSDDVLVSSHDRRDAYAKLLNNGVDAENRGGLKGEHGLLALLYVSKLNLLFLSNGSTNVEVVEGLAVGIESVVVELDKLLYSSENPGSAIVRVLCWARRRYHYVLATLSNSASRVSWSAKIIAFILKAGQSRPLFPRDRTYRTSWAVCWCW